jgi:hypothetical protein
MQRTARPRRAVVASETRKRRNNVVPFNRKEAFRALTVFHTSVDGPVKQLRIALREAGCTSFGKEGPLKPLLVEWVCKSVPDWSSGWKMFQGKVIPNGKHPAVSSIRSKVRDLWLNIQGTTRRNESRPSKQSIASPANVAKFVKFLAKADFRTKKEACATFTLAAAQVFPSKASKPKHKYFSVLSSSLALYCLLYDDADADE